MGSAGGGGGVAEGRVAKAKDCRAELAAASDVIWHLEGVLGWSATSRHLDLFENDERKWTTSKINEDI